MSENVQMRLSQLSLILSIAVHWLLPDFAMFVVPYLFAYMAEYAIKVTDDYHMPNRDFHFVIHATLTIVIGALMWGISMYFLGLPTLLGGIMHWVAYLVTAVVINKVNLVWTKAEAAQTKREG